MTGRKTRVAVLFGGRSAEHEVSIESARSVLAALDPSKYEVLPIAITPAGCWLGDGPSHALLSSAAGVAALASSAEAGESPSRAESRPEAHALAPIANQLPEASAGQRDVDVVIPLIHGTYGEDGTLQGVLEFAGLPYVGAGVAASAVGMDKHMMKVMFRAAGLPVLDWVSVERFRWQRDMPAVRDQIAQQIGYPCFVKPSNMGSSVGVHKVHSPSELEGAMADAFRFDLKVLAERAAHPAREIECSVLGNHDPVASTPGEVVPGREFYDYRAKYLDDTSELVIPAHISAEQTSAVQRLAIGAFRALDCAGMARVDLFLEGETLWLNEINTIPGFTRISMYPKLWEASGLSYARLLDRLICLALERHQERTGLETSYSPDDAKV